MLPRTALVLVGFTLLGAATALLFRSVPTGFIPDEDQGYLIVTLQLPDGASLERTEEVSDRVERILLDTPGILWTNVVGRWDLLENTFPSNSAVFFAVLRDWSERAEAGHSARGMRSPFASPCVREDFSCAR